MNQTIMVKILEEIALILAIMGEPSFRVESFKRAATEVENTNTVLFEKLLKSKSLEQIDGIGSKSAAILYEIEQKGTCQWHDDLKRKIHDDLLILAKIRGIGPKRTRDIYQELGIMTIEEVETACSNESLLKVKGIGKKTISTIRHSLDFYKKNKHFIRIDTAQITFLWIKSIFQAIEARVQLFSTGQLRRGATLVNQLVFILIDQHHTTLWWYQQLQEKIPFIPISYTAEKNITIQLFPYTPLTIKFFLPQQKGAALYFLTGSDEHLSFMYLRSRDYNLTHLYDPKKWQTQLHNSTLLTEKQYYSSLKLPFIHPTLREKKTDCLSLNKQPILLEKKHLLGVIHTHSVYSDGKHTLLQMANACIEQKYQYLVITDHSQSASYAGGLSVSKIYQQWDEIDKLNEHFIQQNIPFIILKGIEVDILDNGQLDYKNQLLSGFDFVIASIHRGLDQTENKLMKRFFHAIDNPYVSMIAHPSGRVLLYREESSINIEQLIQHAAESHTAIEINANPKRLDLDWSYGSIAKSFGLYTAIAPDAHHINGLDDVEYGIMVANKMNISIHHIINTFSKDQFLSWINKKRI